MMDPDDLTRLHGQSVLVKSSLDRHDPPTALRGTIEARPDEGGQPVVRIILDYPDMCNTAARRRVITLDVGGIQRLMADEHDGVYKYTVNHSLDLGSDPAGLQTGP